MFSLAIDELRIVSTKDENQIVVLAEPRWLSRDTATREGDLVIGVEQQTADLINYYMVAHTSSENFVNKKEDGLSHHTQQRLVNPNLPNKIHIEHVRTPEDHI